MNSILLNRILEVVLLGVVSISFLVQFQYWNDSTFKFIIYGFDRKLAKVIAYKNYSGGGYGYSELEIQLLGQNKANNFILKSNWMNEEKKVIEVYVSKRNPLLITNKSNFIIDTSICLVLIICFILWLKSLIKLLKLDKNLPNNIRL